MSDMSETASDYLPSTDEVREEWQYATQDTDMDGNVTVSFDDAGEQFDRWLNQIRAAAWDEGFTVGNRHWGGRRDANPYAEVTGQ